MEPYTKQAIKEWVRNNLDRLRCLLDWCGWGT